MSKSSITRLEYMQLLGLKRLADIATKHVDDIVEAAKLITGEDDKWGHTSDLMWTPDHTVDEQLRKLEIKVLPDPPRPSIAEGWDLEPIIVNDEQAYLLFRGSGESREQIQIDPKTAQIVRELLKLTAPSAPPEDLRAD